MTSRRTWVTIVLVLIALFALDLILQRLPTDERIEEVGAVAYAATVTDDGHAARSHANKRKALRRGHRAFKNGHRKKMHRILKRAYGKHYNRKIPRKVRGKWWRRLGWRVEAQASGRKCGTAVFRSTHETSGVGWDLFWTNMGRRWCWKRGEIVKKGRLKVNQGVTDWGAALNFNVDSWHTKEKGWRGPVPQWHTKYFHDIASRFYSCTPLPVIPGCVGRNGHEDGINLTITGRGKSDGDT